MIKTARVIKQIGKQFLLEDDKKRFDAFPRKKAISAVCGDWVEYQQLEPNPVITKIKKRHNVLSRSGFRQQVKPIAANISQLCAITAPYPGFNPELIDRYAIAAEKLDLSLCVIFNKMDLLAQDTEQKNLHKKWSDIYRQLGYEVIDASTKDPGSIHKIRQNLINQTSIFAGESGVGKSSLIQEIIPQLNLKVGKLSEISQLGKHTTTHSELFELEEGGEIIDSPGVRSFDVSHFELADIQKGFVEINRLGHECRYNNCSHINEPEKHCAVKQAVAQKEIAPERYENYKAIFLFEPSE